MDADLLALAREAVAAPGWRWLPGMRAIRPDGSFPLRVVQVGAEPAYAHEEPAHPDGWVSAARGLWGTDLPDLADPCTLGGLLALVREAWGDGGIYACHMDGYDAYEWVCIVDTERLAPRHDFPHTRSGVTWFDGESEPAALVAALRAAPKEGG